MWVYGSKPNVDPRSTLDNFKVLRQLIRSIHSLINKYYSIMANLFKQAVEISAASENNVEREVIECTILDVQRLVKIAKVPARIGDVVMENVDGVEKELKIETEEQAKGFKIEIPRYTVTLKTPEGQHQFSMLETMLPKEPNILIGKRANAVLTARTLTEDVVNENTGKTYPKGMVQINCVKLTPIEHNDFENVLKALLTGRISM